MVFMPVATTTLTRQGESVSAVCERKIFFIVPFQTDSVSKIIRIDDEVVHGSLSRTLPSGSDSDRRRPPTYAEDMASIRITGSDGTVDVPVSPANLDSVRRRLTNFMADANQKQLSVFTVTNWKWSVVGGGLLCLLPLLYVGTLVQAIIRHTRASQTRTRMQ